MLRTPLAKAYLKRTIRPLYGWTQTTPKAMYLDAAWDRSIQIWPGMGMMRTSGDNVTLLNNVGYPYGLVGNYIGGDGIDELLDAGVNALAVWVLEADAEFEILSPAFDTTATWTDPGDGTNAFVYVNDGTASDVKRGKLVPVADAHHSARPIARLLKVNSATKITIGGLVGTTG